MVPLYHGGPFPKLEFLKLELGISLIPFILVDILHWTDSVFPVSGRQLGQTKGGQGVFLVVDRTKDNSAHALLHILLLLLLRGAGGGIPRWGDRPILEFGEDECEIQSLSVVVTCCLQVTWSSTVTPSKLED
ncbi:hypothetical protein E2C01_070218 [Portunus trituberculatus]|uniref:Uncharacterized protein n=1 Tax=Portunus trituberculatus TaxID=210409 RepID=A0A5B7HS42_PORTR|nr:hypothetical protein [Portunus trituberculatus]